MSIMNLKVRHNAQVKTIALYNGLASEELRSVLQAVFLLGPSSVVVGFLSPEVRDYYQLKQKLIYYIYCSGKFRSSLRMSSYDALSPFRVVVATNCPSNTSCSNRMDW